MEGNTAWVLASAALVLFMTPGLAFFYGGMVRSKNVLGMLMQNFFAMGLVSVLWALVGFSLAFGRRRRVDRRLRLRRPEGSGQRRHCPAVRATSPLTIPALVFVAYQMMFAIITPALITGATADRMKFAALRRLPRAPGCCSCTPRWPTGCSAPAGWLFKRGALDFAGGTVVHINAGIAALALVLVLGKRKGWPGEAMPPHSLPLTLLGTGILWFGWFGFNAGSALGANAARRPGLHEHPPGRRGGHAAAGCWSSGIKDGHATTLGAASGAVAGLVAITPCAGFVGGLSPHRHRRSSPASSASSPSS